jgi:bud emergence protein 1
MERTGSPQSRNSDYYNYQSASTPSTSALRTSPAISSRSRSHSSAAASNLNTPTISAANPQTAFVKIKIFDRVADDLIAIRVHPRVTHAELMDKVQSRLGGEVANLRYRDSLTNDFVGLDSDSDLRIWMDSTDKHVLYAD